MNHPKNKNKTLAIISILFVVLIWGSAFTVSKVGVTELPPLFLALMRNAVASIALFPFYLVVRRKFPETQSQRLPAGLLVILSLTGITFFYSFFNISLTYTGAAMGSLIQGILPVMIAIPAAIFLKEKIKGPLLAGIIISVTGVLFVGFIGKADENNSAWGNILMIFSVCCWAAYTILSKRIEHLHPVPVIFFVTLLGTIFLLPMVVIEGWGKPFPVISSKVWVAILYLGLLSSALCYILYNQSLKTLTAAQVGNFLNLDPVIGSAIALIFLNESFTVLQYAGGILVLAGVWLSSASVSNKKHQ